MSLQTAARPLAATVALVVFLWLGWAVIRPELSILVGTTAGFTSTHLRFVLWWALAGSIAVILLARLFESTGLQVASTFLRGTDRQWAVGLGLGALAIGVFTRVFVFQHMPVTDDEPTYLFSAQLLAGGTLWAESAPDKVFWDRIFMINDGRWYTQYFLGWPGLLAPFVALGAPGLANPVWFAATVPPWLGVLRRAVPEQWARAGTLLFVLSPMAASGAGTLMSHTSELCMLVWAFWAAFRLGDEDAPPWTGGVLGTAFSLAFFNRPLTALTVGAPALGIGFHAIIRRRAWTTLALFALPSALLGCAFLAVNHLQNGSVSTVSYTAAVEYAKANDERFAPASHWGVANWDGLVLIRQLVVQALGWGRLQFAMWGWPMVLLLLVDVPWRQRELRPWLAAIACFSIGHLTLRMPGIDTFGPVHFFELTLPATAILAATFARADTDGQKILGASPWAVFAAATALALGFYTPVRLGTIRAMTNDVRTAWDATAPLDRAIVYVPLHSFVTTCGEPRPQPVMFYRPNPDPWLKDPILFANHLTVEEDREHHQKWFADRSAWVFQRDDDCNVILVPLHDQVADAIPPGPQKAAPPLAEQAPNGQAQ